MNLGLAELIILKCTDERGKDWTIVPPDEVPSKIKNDPQMIEWMVEGCQPQFPGESTIYAAMKVGSPMPKKLGSAIKVANEVMH